MNVCSKQILISITQYNDSIKASSMKKKRHCSATFALHKPPKVLKSVQIDTISKGYRTAMWWMLKWLSSLHLKCGLTAIRNSFRVCRQFSELIKRRLCSIKRHLLYLNERQNEHRFRKKSSYIVEIKLMFYDLLRVQVMQNENVLNF